MLGYHAIAWRGDDFPRYFAPCFPLVGVLIADLQISRRVAAVVAVLIVCGSMSQYVHLLSHRRQALAELVHTTRDGLALAEQLEADPRDCITVTDMDAGIGFYSRTASFACCFAQWTDFAATENGALCP
jgi:hypothetical protein